MPSFINAKQLQDTCFISATGGIKRTGTLGKNPDKENVHVSIVGGLKKDFFTAVVKSMEMLLKLWCGHRVECFLKGATLCKNPFFLFLGAYIRASEVTSRCKTI